MSGRLEGVQERIQALHNLANLQRKIRQIMPLEDESAVISVLNQAGEGSGARLSFAILRCCEGSNDEASIAQLRRVVATALVDYRDVLVLTQLREAQLPFSASKEERKSARLADAEEYLDWLMK